MNATELNHVHNHRSIYASQKSHTPQSTYKSPSHTGREQRVHEDRDVYLKRRKVITSRYKPCPAFPYRPFTLVVMSSPSMPHPPPLPTSTATHLQRVQSVLKGGLVCKHVLLEPLLVLVELLAAVLHLLTDLVGPAQRGPSAGRRRDRRVQVHTTQTHTLVCLHTHSSSHLASKSSLDRGWQ